MLRAWKHYWAFTNSTYKLVMLLIVPILVIGANMLVELSGDAGEYIWVVSMMYLVDTIGDMFFMGGFYRRGNTALEFMQSSSKFSIVAKNIVTVDVVRRVLMYQIPVIITIMGAKSIEELQGCKISALWSWVMILIAQCVVVVSRHYELWRQMYVCIAIGHFVMMFIFLFFAFVFEGLPVIVNIVLMVLVVFVGIATVWYTDKKVRESYYDS